MRRMRFGTFVGGILLGIACPVNVDGSTPVILDRLIAANLGLPDPGLSGIRIANMAPGSRVRLRRSASQLERQRDLPQ